MSEVEKLRALLAEARGALTAGCYCGNSYCTGTAINKLRDRIDAALAEPVDGEWGFCHQCGCDNCEAVRAEENEDAE